MRVNSPSFSTSSLQLRRALPFAVVTTPSSVIVASAFMMILILLRINKTSMQSRYTTILFRCVRSSTIVRLLSRATEEIGDQVRKQPVTDAVGNVNFAVLRIDRETGGMEQPAEWATQFCQRRRIAFVGNAPDKGNTPPLAKLGGPFSGLLHPTGLAINPKDGEIYVSDSIRNGLFTYLVPDFFGGSTKKPNDSRRAHATKKDCCVARLH